MEKRRDGAKWFNLLLLKPCLAVLCVPIYNFVESRILGLPFFYAWQIGWIGLGAVVTGLLVYVVAWKGRDV